MATGSSPNHYRCLVFIVIATLGVAGCGQRESPPPVAASPTVTQDQGQIVEAACGTCQFGMDGTGCQLAVRMDGQSYWVDGTSLDDHGDAHAEHGMCLVVRQARVSGSVADGRFTATSFELLPYEGASE